MMSKSICEQDGYKREDLSKEKQITMNWLDYMQEQIENLKNNLAIYYDFEIDDEDLSLLDQMKREIVLEAIDNVLDWYETEKYEVQIALAESDE